MRATLTNMSLGFIYPDKGRVCAIPQPCKMSWRNAYVCNADALAKTLVVFVGPDRGCRVELKHRMPTASTGASASQCGHDCQLLAGRLLRMSKILMKF